MTGGSRMEVAVDDLHGQAVGSHIKMSGTVVGLRVELDEVVTVRTPPIEKEWETVGTPKLIVIGHYRMRVDLEARDTRTLLRVSIDHDLPERNLWLGRAFGRMYAKWCVRQMVRGAVQEFLPARAVTSRWVEAGGTRSS